MAQKDTTIPTASPEAAKDAPNQRRVIAALSIAVTLLIIAMMAGYTRFGAEFLRRRDDSIGDMLMREGKRIEAGGLHPLALETYERALNARFNGASNRTFTLERAGELQWQAENFEKAAGYLSRALEGPGASPAPYEALVDSLIHLGRLDEARQRLSDWKETLASGDGDPAAYGHALGMLAEAEGDTAKAVIAYEGCASQYSHALSAARLGILYSESGQRDKALEYLEQYFRLGAPGKDNETLHSLYADLARESALP